MVLCLALMHQARKYSCGSLRRYEQLKDGGGVIQTRFGEMVGAQSWTDSCKARPLDCEVHSLDVDADRIAVASYAQAPTLYPMTKE